MRRAKSGLGCTFPLLLAIGFNILRCNDARSALVLNEVLYDPDGPDAGREFVEIMNTGPFAAVLDGLSIEAGNGSRPNDCMRYPPRPPLFAEPIDQVGDVLFRTEVHYVGGRKRLRTVHPHIERTLGHHREAAIRIR